jgi:hypothetical protein
MPDAETSPLPLMSPPQRPASRASHCSGQREGRMPDLRFVVFAARRKPPPTSWSRAARAGGHRTLTRRGNRGPRLSRGASMVTAAGRAPGRRAQRCVRGVWLQERSSQWDRNMATRCGTRACGGLQSHEKRRCSRVKRASLRTPRAGYILGPRFRTRQRLARWPCFPKDREADHRRQVLRASVFGAFDTLRPSSFTNTLVGMHRT